MHLASDYIHPYKEPEEVGHTAGFGSTYPMTCATLLW